MSALARRQRPLSAEDAALARSCEEGLARVVRKNKSLKLKVGRAGQEQSLELPAGAVMLLMNMLEAMAAKRAVTLIMEYGELTAVHAAEMLGVSRPFLTRILDENRLPYTRIGSHRRIRIEDVLTYKAKLEAERLAIMQKLVA